MQADTFRLPKSDLDRLLTALKQQGYRVMAPVQRDITLMWDEIEAAADLPWGIAAEQSPGHYRLAKGDASRCFDATHGPQSLKPLTFAPRQKLGSARQTGKQASTGIHIDAEQPVADAIAIIGARACDLAALAMQEKIFMQGAYPDPYFAARRKALFIIAVHCSRSDDTCFCAAMQTGPRARAGFDIAMSELDEIFLLEAGSKSGEAILEMLQLPAAEAAETALAEQQMLDCANSQKRSIDQAGLPEALYDAHNHPHWQDVAGRCLSCANCTMVCPTCFCHAVEEVPSLAGDESSRFRIWDSCFSPEHGYIHGKNMRPGTRERYRMWMSHKLAGWIGQFGSSGCVGCGRCISWCPVGIDITAEYAKLRQAP